ncbi:TatD family hydrolase [Candidatus Zixiibacteriota bacterium]
MLIDSHAHLDFSQFKNDREQVIQRALDAGLAAIVNVGTDLPSSEKSADLARKHAPIYAVVGVHPHDAKTLTPSSLTRLTELAEDPKVVAIGEIGLDFYRDLSPRHLQREAFRQQIRLAIELDIPMVIHDRDAHAEVLDIMHQEEAHRVGGVLHCFSGDLEMARQGLEMGFYIAFGGPITYGGGKKQEIARHIPLNRILVETDCPFLTPVPHRGQRNEPAYVRYVVEKLAELRGVSFEKVAQATGENAMRVFRLRMCDIGD